LIVDAIDSGAWQGVAALGSLKGQAE